MSTEPRKGLDLPPMCNAGPDGPCDDEWCQGHAATPKTYYDAPEPDDLQRRCWIIDDGQCRLYNGHEGGHDFGGGGRDPNMDYERRDAMLDVVRRQYATPDRADPADVDHLHTLLAARLATPDRADPRTPKPCGVVFGNTDDGTTGRCGVIGYGHDGPHVATPDRADPERRAEGLTWSGGFYCTTHERFCQRASGHRAALTPPPAGNELEEGK